MIITKIDFNSREDFERAQALLGEKILHSKKRKYDGVIYVEGTGYIKIDEYEDCEIHIEGAIFDAAGEVKEMSEEAFWELVKDKRGGKRENAGRDKKDDAIRDGEQIRIRIVTLKKLRACPGKTFDEKIDILIEKIKLLENR